MKNPNHKNENALMKWHFPARDHGSSEGLADPLLQYFEGDHERYVAREAIQNSLDARLNPQEPVRVVFERIKLPTNNLPGGKELRSRLLLCLEQSPQGEDKTRQFFERAVEVARQPKIDILKISDYNTRGLDGPDEAETEKDEGRWHRLVRAVGENRMSGPGGGSFGIGKGAPFAASLVRTVYYSTLNEQGEHIFQGKARLLSHQEKGTKRRGEGFYGIEGWKSVRSLDLIPLEFQRKEQGTDLQVISYDFGQRRWKKGLAKSVLENFWMAILQGDLEVSILEEGSVEFEITKATLPEHLENLSHDEAYPYYLAVTAPARLEERPLPVLGNCKLYLIKGEGFPKRVALMRKPKMVVRNKQFRIMQDGFAGVFLCDDDQGNRILREMEPPQHDNWVIERHPEHGREAWTEIMSWIKETLRDMAGAETGKPEEIPDLDRFLPYDEESEKDEDQGDVAAFSGGAVVDESGSEVGAEREEELDPVDDVVQRPSSAIRGSGKNEGSSGPLGPTEIESPGNGAGEQKGNAIFRVNTAAIKFRTIAGSINGNIREYCLILDSLADQKGSLNVIAVGDDNNYPIKLAGAEFWDNGEPILVKESFLENLKLEKDKRIKIRLRLQSRISYALGIESYEN